MPGYDVIFMCIENAGRSQMAEAFFRRYAGAAFAAASAGARPAPRVHPVVVRAMGEVGIDLGSRVPQAVSDELLAACHGILVNMGCMGEGAGESCPAPPAGTGTEVINWNIPDPRGRPIEEVRGIRDTVEIHVRELVSGLREGRDDDPVQR